MPVVYRLGDVFVLPSRGPGETWGLAINEAMACGRAVVASTKVGCAPDLIEDGTNGFVFESENEEALAETLQLLVDRPDLRARMGAASARRIEDWSLDEAARRLVCAVRAHAESETRVKAAQKDPQPRRKFGRS
jgi:glycosyltransferase involved in cell wall biosynthesis